MLATPRLRLRARTIDDLDATLAMAPMPRCADSWAVRRAPRPIAP